MLAMDTRLVVFLPTLQRVKSNFIVQNLKIKETYPRLGERQASNATVRNSFCAEDAFCQAFVICNPVRGSWCESKEQLSVVFKTADHRCENR